MPVYLMHVSKKRRMTTSSIDVITDTCPKLGADLANLSVSKEAHDDITYFCLSFSSPML